MLFLFIFAYRITTRSLYHDFEDTLCINKYHIIFSKLLAILGKIFHTKRLNEIININSFPLRRTKVNFVDTYEGQLCWEFNILSLSLNFKTQQLFQLKRNTLYLIVARYVLQVYRGIFPCCTSSHILGRRIHTVRSLRYFIPYR